MNKKEMHRFLVDADLARIAYQIDVEDYYDLALLERRLQRWNEEEANGTIQWNDDGTPIRFSDDGYELGSIRNGKASIIKQIEKIKNSYGTFDIYYQGDCSGVQIYLYSRSALESSGYPIDQIYSSIGHACYIPKF